MTPIHHAAAWLPAHPLPVAAALALIAAVQLAQILALLCASAEQRFTPIGYRSTRPDLATLIAADWENQAWLRDPDADAAGWGYSRAEPEPVAEPVPGGVEGWGDGEWRTGELSLVHPAGGAA